jgi:hypothetical protein
MMDDIEKFIKNNKPIGKSKLSSFDEKIIKLLSLGYKAGQIHEFIIKRAKVNVSLSHLYFYIKKLQAGDNPKATVPSVKTHTAITAPAIVEKESKTTGSSSVQEPQKKMSLLEKTAAFLQAQKEAGVEPAPIGYYKPKTLMIDILDKQDE